MDDFYIIPDNCPICNELLIKIPRQTTNLITITKQIHCKKKSSLRSNYFHFETTPNTIWIDLESIKITVALFKDATILYNEGMQILKLPPHNLNELSFQDIENKVKIWLTFS